jgi:hypothetical protein
MLIDGVNKRKRIIKMNSGKQKAMTEKSHADQRGR